MYDTIRKVKNMLNNAKTAEYFEYIEKITRHFEQIDLIWDPSYGISKEDWIAFTQRPYKCNGCGKPDFDYNLFPIKMPDSEQNVVYYCPECICENKDIHWCVECGEPFFDKLNKDSFYCKDCEAKMNND
jgi:hypothetical protein